MEFNYNPYQAGLPKLFQHLEHLIKVKEGKPVAPIHVSVWPTIRCQFSCNYCCCGKEDRREPDLPIGDFVSVLGVLKHYGTKAIEFSGGGEPLLWPDICEAVDMAARYFKLSLITNGVLLSDIPERVLGEFSWIRVSVLSMEQLRRTAFERIPKKTKVSLSHILSCESDLPNLYKFAKERNYITRLAIPQKGTLTEQTKEALKKYDYPFFFSYKPTGTPLGCYMAWIRAAIDWRGNFLPCPAVMLAEGYKILDKFKLCHIRDLEEWLTNNRPKDLGYRCGFCNCGKEINDFIHQINEGCLYSEFV